MTDHVLSETITAVEYPLAGRFLAGDRVIDLRWPSLPPGRWKGEALIRLSASGDVSLWFGSPPHASYHKIGPLAHVSIIGVEELKSADTLESDRRFLASVSVAEPGAGGRTVHKKIGSFVIRHPDGLPLAFGLAGPNFFVDTLGRRLDALANEGLQGLDDARSKLASLREEVAGLVEAGSYDPGELQRLLATILNGVADRAAAFGHAVGLMEADIAKAETIRLGEINKGSHSKGGKGRGRAARISLGAVGDLDWNMLAESIWQSDSTKTRYAVADEILKIGQKATPQWLWNRDSVYKAIKPQDPRKTVNKQPAKPGLRLVDR